jgi:hypothetical protein
MTNDEKLDSIVKALKFLQGIDVNVLELCLDVGKKSAEVNQAHTRLFRSMAMAASEDKRPKLLRSVAALETLDEKLEASIANLQSAAVKIKAMIDLPPAWRQINAIPSNPAKFTRPQIW